MNRRVWVITIAVLSGGAVFAAAAEIEVGAPVRVTPRNGFAFYNPTGIAIGKYLYVYAQGTGAAEDEASCGRWSDKIIAFRAPLVDGVPGEFERVGRISPCVNAPVTDVHHPYHPNPPASFGPGQIFRATVGRARKYHLLADVSDTINFFHVWRGESADGINWKWFISDGINNQQFHGRRETIRDRSDAVEHTIDVVVQPESFIRATKVAMLNPILLPAHGAINNAQWWGFFNFWLDTFAIGRMTIDWDLTGTVPAVRMVESVSGSQYRWRALTPTGTGTFLLDFKPHAFRTRANAKTLLYDIAPDGYQLWASDDTLGSYGANVNCDTEKIVRCDRPEGCLTADGSGCEYGYSCSPFLRNTGDHGDSVRGLTGGFVWWPVSRSTFDPAGKVLRSDSRFMPSGYVEARLFPFRWNSPAGKRYLFSATNDANICDEFLFSAYYKMYVVKTELVRE
jgi:hypothetical protein